MQQAGRTWTVLICEPAQHGHSEAASSFLFEMIRKASVRPNELTFTGVLVLEHKQFEMAEPVVEQVKAKRENDGEVYSPLEFVCFGWEVRGCRKSEEFNGQPTCKEDRGI
ncbi:hypothetical protein DVH24_010994 [Malus domestica]|uniref:Uncharacterized protein n=1 Tax=Malus domestica TaxID=3750 RepID=A0A498JRV1_MALDO|nr:hypothetical protein DVH24_010994 [Malus domestica]